MFLVRNLPPAFPCGGPDRLLCVQTTQALAQHLVTRPSGFLPWWLRACYQMSACKSRRSLSPSMKAQAPLLMETLYQLKEDVNWLSMPVQG